MDAMSPPFPRLTRSADELRRVVPTELTDRPQWVAWRTVDRGGKQTKVPTNIHSGRNASATDPATWATFDDALAFHAREPESSGIGFVFTTADPFAGIDLDHCIDESGVLKPWADAIVTRFPGAYVECSPSGTGLKLFVRGRTLHNGRRSGYPEPGAAVEMYDRGRYFTVTGDAYGAAPAMIPDANGALGELGVEVFPPKPKVARPDASNRGLDLADADVIEHARGASNGAKFAALWAGDTSAHNGDASSADLALLSMLAFYTGNDPAQLDRLFRRSGLYREKWERPDYRDRTIAKALDGRVEFYSVSKATCGATVAANRAAHGATPTEVGDLPGLATADGRLSEIGNARLLAAHAAGRLRYCEAFGWLWYDGAIWKPDESAARELCQQSMLTLYQRAQSVADPTERKAIVRWAERYAQSQAGITHTLLLARDHPEFRTRTHELDAHRDLIVFPNGTLEPDGTFRPNRPGDLVTQAMGVPYGPGARCPTWDRFLGEIMLERKALVQYLHGALGYSASGRTDQQCFFVCWGGGWNGKSVLLASARHVLGTYARGANRAAFVGGRNEDPRRALAALYGARFASFTETGKGAALDEGLIKAVTGGDPVTAAALYKNEFTYVPTWKLWFATNHKPVIRDATASIWGRIRLIPFEASFPPGSPRRDEHLLDRLLAEGPGIAQRIATGWLTYRNGIGLPTPDVVRVATDRYREEEDRLGPFLAECCNLGPDLRCASGVLYQAYRRWAERDGTRKPMTQTALGRELGERGFVAEREQTGERRVMRLGLDTSGVP
jgi:putative DNA primase/helicase